MDPTALIEVVKAQAYEAEADVRIMSTRMLQQLQALLRLQRSDQTSFRNARTCSQAETVGRLHHNHTRPITRHRTIAMQDEALPMMLAEKTAAMLVGMVGVLGGKALGTVQGTVVGTQAEKPSLEMVTAAPLATEPTVHRNATTVRFLLPRSATITITIANLHDETRGFESSGLAAVLHQHRHHPPGHSEVKLSLLLEREEELLRQRTTAIRVIGDVIGEMVEEGREEDRAMRDHRWEAGRKEPGEGLDDFSPSTCLCGCEPSKVCFLLWYA